MSRLVNDTAVTWAAIQTELAIHDRCILQSMTLLLGQHERDLMSTPEKIAAVYQLAEHLVDGSITHLCQYAYITPLTDETGATGYRINYTQTDAVRKSRAVSESSYRPLPVYLTTAESTAA